MVVIIKLKNSGRPDRQPVRRQLAVFTAKVPKALVLTNYSKILENFQLAENINRKALK
jgi:hypothetical protein